MRIIVYYSVMSGRGRMGSRQEVTRCIQGNLAVMRQYEYLSGTCITLDHGYERPYDHGTLEGRGEPWGSRVAL